MPPEKLANGEYDLGVQIYSDEFNKLTKGVQDNYLKLYSTKDGVTDYKLLINAMNDIVAKAVDFIHL
jgi:hypothetical protein